MHQIHKHIEPRRKCGMATRAFALSSITEIFPISFREQELNSFSLKLHKYGREWKKQLRENVISQQNLRIFVKNSNFREVFLKISQIVIV